MTAPMLLTAAWSIELAGADPVARFAAQELRQTLQRLGAPLLPLVEQARGPRIALRHGGAGDDFRRMPDDDGLLLIGGGPRGLLYAVYDLLEALGCRWLFPGPAGTHLPAPADVILPPDVVAATPALAGRGLVIGHDLFLHAAADWIDWAAHNRLNTIFMHTIDRLPPFGACRLRTWRRRRAALLPLLHERGMQLELGGHGLAALVPRKLLRTTPQAFRAVDRQRRADYNFCPSSPEAQALLRLNGAAFLRAYPEAQVYHLWADDILGGGWCACERCAGLSPADQALLAVNTLAEVLSECNPAARISHLAYHDTIAAPQQVAPHPNVQLVFAPRQRSYAQGIGAADPVNRPFAELLAANQAHFAGGAHVFEYYLDGILFKSAPPPLPDVIQADLCAYTDSGVAAVNMLLTGDRPWLVAPLNAYLFARLAWNPAQDPARLVAGYAALRAPHAGPDLAQAYTALAAAWRPALAFTPAEQAGRTADNHRQFARRRSLPVRVLGLVGQPPADVLDYMAAPHPAPERRFEYLRAGEPQLAHGAAAWQQVLALPHVPPDLLAEYAEWQHSALLLRFLIARQQLYVLAGRAARRPVLAAAYTEARSALAALEAWGTAQLPGPRTLAGYRLFRRIFDLHLATVYDRRLALPWQRVGLRLALFSAFARDGWWQLLP